MKKIFLAATFLLYALISFGQNPRYDSFPNWQPVSNVKATYDVKGLLRSYAFRIPVLDTLNHPATSIFGSITQLPSDSALRRPIVYITDGYYWRAWQGTGGGAENPDIADTFYLTDGIYLTINDIGQQIIHGSRVTTIAGLRATTDPQADVIYVTTDNDGATWVWEDTLTAVDNGSTIIEAAPSVTIGAFRKIGTTGILSITADNGLTEDANNVQLGSSSSTGSPLLHHTFLYGNSAYTVNLNNVRFEHDKGGDIAAANNLTLGFDGNVFGITGTTQINAITSANWQAGSTVSLIFASTPTVKHNTAGGAGTSVILLAGSIDFVATANDVLNLVYDGTSWHETSRKVAATGGTNVYGANNGTEMVLNTVKLGGNPLLANTFIPTSPYTLSITGNTSSSNGVLKVSNTLAGNAPAISATAVDGAAVTGVSTTNTAVSGTSTSGKGGLFQSASGTGFEAITSSASSVVGSFSTIPTSTNTVRTLVNLNRYSTSPGANGIGGAIDFNLYTSISTGRLGTRLTSKLTDATDATYSSEFSIKGVSNAVQQDIFTISGNGSTKLNKYGVGTFTGTAAYSLAVDASGNIIEEALGGGGGGGRFGVSGEDDFAAQNRDFDIDDKTFTIFRTNTSSDYVQFAPGAHDFYLDDGTTFTEIYHSTTFANLHAQTFGGAVADLSVYADGTINLTTDNYVKFSSYGAGARTGTPAYTLQVDASGNIIEGALGGSTRFGVSGEDDIAAEVRKFETTASYPFSITAGNDENTQFGIADGSANFYAEKDGLNNYGGFSAQNYVSGASEIITSSLFASSGNVAGKKAEVFLSVDDAAGATSFMDLIVHSPTSVFMRMIGLPTYANEAAASSLPTNTVYQTATGELRIKL